MQKLSTTDPNQTTVSVLTGLSKASYLHVDNDGNIYLSDTYNHQVLLFSFNSMNGTRVAGNGTEGSGDDQLNLPYGVYVTDMRTIYIADWLNHRIMKWFSGASFGIVVAGNGTDGNSSTLLDRPTQILVDTNAYMYISEYGNKRITRWAPNSTFGVCIVACTRESGIKSTQLNAPRSLAFDSKGSLYVTDFGNNRVQKFQFLRYQRK